MYECKYPHLFSGIRLGNTVFRNRIFGAPLGYCYSDPRGYPLDETIGFFENLALGGAASVNFGSAVPDSQRGRGGPLYNPGLDDPELAPPLHRLISAINRHGAVAVIELWHAGANAYRSKKMGHQIYGVVDGPNAIGEFIPGMPEAIIEETIEAYGEAAAFAKYCGFGMVMVHAGHGWLLNQFLDPNTNKRRDRWGGSLENRCRFPLAVLARIKQMCGRDFPVEVRISGSMCYTGGYGIDEGVEIAKQLDGKADLINVSVGSHEVPEAFPITHPSMFLPDGVNVEYAVEIKKHVKTPVATVGSLSNPELMEEIIATGKADVITIGRALMADPHLPQKARSGNPDEIRPCLRCLTCFSTVMAKHEFNCAVNPEIGFEQDARHALPQTGKKTVLIAGGGVAGMQAALTAAERGHKVILCEKNERLGGALRCEENVPFKKHLAEYLDYQVRMISRAPVDVRTSTEVTAALAKAVSADVIIAALGARPVVPHISGIDRKNVLGAEEAYYHPEKTGKNVVIIGGGLVGVEAGIYLAGLGRKVTIIEMMESLNDGGNLCHGLALNVQIKKYGIQLSTGTRVEEINENGLTGAYVGNTYTLPVGKTVQLAPGTSNTFGRAMRDEPAKGTRKFFAADTVIYAIGQRPLYAEAETLRLCAPEFYQIGDCLAAKNIQQATSMAFAIARDI
jgi:2,4-dienoyl-CoA reductase-like NADH-dependent reductase (Old Yellow Enzyme family)/NADPH-dependent 2,4-dienoyl-CoA reductase/sulfur reductase-like enzyme